jgi:hypothetical protein
MTLHGVLHSTLSDLAETLRPLNTFAEVADAARCSRRTVERAAEAGELQVIRRGNAQRPLVPRSSVLRWLGLSEAS